MPPRLCSDMDRRQLRGDESVRFFTNETDLNMNTASLFSRMSEPYFIH